MASLAQVFKHGVRVAAVLAFSMAVRAPASASPSLNQGGAEAEMLPVPGGSVRRANAKCR